MAKPVQTAANDLPWHSLFWLDDYWLHDALDTAIASPIYSDRRLLEYVGAVREAGGFTTLNAGIYQDGTLSSDTLEQLRKVGRHLANFQPRPIL